MTVQDSGAPQKPQSHKVFPILRHAPPILPAALAGSGLGLIAAALVFWRIAHLFPQLCSIPHALSTPPTLPLPTPPALPTPPHTEVNAARATEDAQLAHAAGGHTGKLEIILTWGDKNDLDLHVVTPNEEQIFFKHRAADGGRLDLDANQAAAQAAAVQESGVNKLIDNAKVFLGDNVTSSVWGSISPEKHLTNRPVEHVTWENAPPSGHYSVQVDPYAMAFSETSPYHVSVLYNGQPLKSQSGVAKRGQTIELAPTDTTVVEFDIP